jgi:hypothetical protein
MDSDGRSDGDLKAMDGLTAMDGSLMVMDGTTAPQRRWMV